jgi:hypothetical protein
VEILILLDRRRVEKIAIERFDFLAEIHILLGPDRVGHNNHRSGPDGLTDGFDKKFMPTWFEPSWHEFLISNPALALFALFSRARDARGYRGGRANRANC